MPFQKGDTVYYIGSDKKILQDYGKRALTVVAIDRVNRRLVCKTTNNYWLVGVPCSDLSLNSPKTQLDQGNRAAG